MAASNIKTTHSHLYADACLAGGYGPHAAKQPNEALLRRLVMSNLLWEDNAYVDGKTVVDQIKELIPSIHPTVLSQIAVEARVQQKLRHIPLLLLREMARHPLHKEVVVLPQTMEEVIRRPDELSEFLALYWKDNGEKKTLSSQVKRGLARAYRKFGQYQLSKWDRGGKGISLKDVLFLCHAKPKDQEQDLLWKQLILGTLPPADTWEVGLSATKSKEEKRDVWTRLVLENKLGAFAFLKNMRNMIDVEVPRSIITQGLLNLKPDMLLPIDFHKAAKHAPAYLRELEDAMLKCAREFPKLRGRTVFVVDVSGSMQAALSGKSEFNRLGVAAAMTVLASEICDSVSIYATAGNDGLRIHSTEWIKPVRGFALSDAIIQAQGRLGGGGIFTRQCLEHIQVQEKEQPDRIIVFSDSQDCDHTHSRTPRPFGKHNYIVDVSCHKHGVNYQGIWTAEVSGWSEHFLRFIAALEGSDSLQ